MIALLCDIKISPVGSLD